MISHHDDDDDDDDNDDYDDDYDDDEEEEDHMVFIIAIIIIMIIIILVPNCYISECWISVNWVPWNRHCSPRKCKESLLNMYQQLQRASLHLATALFAPMHLTISVCHIKHKILWCEVISIIHHAKLCRTPPHPLLIQIQKCRYVECISGFMIETRGVDYKYDDTINPRHKGKLQK